MFGVCDGSVLHPDLNMMTDTIFASERSSVFLTSLMFLSAGPNFKFKLWVNINLDQTLATKCDQTCRHATNNEMIMFFGWFVVCGPQKKSHWLAIQLASKSSCIQNNVFWITLGGHKFSTTSGLQTKAQKHLVCVCTIPHLWHTDTILLTVEMCFAATFVCKGHNGYNKKSILATELKLLLLGCHCQTRELMNNCKQETHVDLGQLSCEKLSCPTCWLTFSSCCTKWIAARIIILCLIIFRISSFDIWIDKAKAKKSQLIVVQKSISPKTEEMKTNNP